MDFDTSEALYELEVISKWRLFDCDIEEQRDEGLIESKFGLVVDLKKDGAKQDGVWARAIEYVLLESRERQGWIREGQKRIKEFDIENIVKLWKKLGLGIQ